MSNNPHVTMRLTEAEVRHWIRNHSEHITYAAARRIVGGHHAAPSGSSNQGG